MVLGSFLTSGLLTLLLSILVAIVVMVIFYFLWKLILSPIFSFLGFGKKNMGELADYASKKYIDSIFQSKNENERRKEENYEQGALGKNNDKEKELINASKGLIDNIKDSNDFNIDKVNQLKSFVTEQNKILEEEQSLTSKLSSQIKEDSRAAKTIFNNVKNIAQAQDKIMTLALKRAKSLQELKENPFIETEIIRIGKNIRGLSEQIGIYEQQEKKLNNQIKDLLDQQLSLLKKGKGLIDDIEKALNKDPVMPQLQKIETNVLNINELETKRIPFIGATAKLVTQRNSLVEATLDLESKIIEMGEQQRKFILQSTAKIADLIRRGIASKKLVA